MSNELRDIVLDYVFLLYKGFLGERVGKCSSLTGMVCIVGHGKSRYSYNRLNRADVYWIFVEVGMARTVPVDILPCLYGVEVEFCWGDSNHWAIFVVEKFVLESDASF